METALTAGLIVLMSRISGDQDIAMGWQYGAQKLHLFLRLDPTISAMQLIAQTEIAIRTAPDVPTSTRHQIEFSFGRPPMVGHTLEETEIEWQVWEPRDLRGAALFRSDLFDAPSIASYAQLYRGILQGLAANSLEPVSTLGFDA
jgi:hypothetical protein